MSRRHHTSLLVLLLALALALVAAGRAARLRVVALAFLAADALHQHAAALAVCDQSGAAARLRSLLARPGLALVAARLRRFVFRLFAVLPDRQVEIRAGLFGDTLAELV